jgi:hypothetical protein
VKAALIGGGLRVVNSLLKSLQIALSRFQFGDLDPAPALGCADKRGWLASRVTPSIVRR